MYATGHLHWIFSLVTQVSLPNLMQGTPSGTQEKVEIQSAEQAEVKPEKELEQKPKKKPKKEKVEKKGRDKKPDTEGKSKEMLCFVQRCSFVSFCLRWYRSRTVFHILVTCSIDLHTVM